MNRLEAQVRARRAQQQLCDAIRDADYEFCIAATFGVLSQPERQAQVASVNARLRELRKLRNQLKGVR